jgi:hypothetical protein
VIAVRHRIITKVVPTALPGLFANAQALHLLEIAVQRLQVKQRQ